MSDERDSEQKSEALQELRKRLEKITEIKNVPLEEVVEVSDTKADSEAFAIATRSYDRIERDRKKAETRSIVESNLDARVNRRLRWKYAKWVFLYLIFYSGFVGVLLILSAWKVCGFSLPSSVLDFLVGSTAAAAIGLVYAVTHGLFSKQ